MTNPLASVKQCRMGTEHSDIYEAQQCDFGSMILACILRLEEIVSDHHDRPTRERRLLRRAKEEIMLRDRLVKEAKA